VTCDDHIPFARSVTAALRPCARGRRLMMCALAAALADEAVCVRSER
jgi:hypothetical protein